MMCVVTSNIMSANHSLCLRCKPRRCVLKAITKNVSPSADNSQRDQRSFDTSDPLANLPRSVVTSDIFLARIDFNGMILSFKTKLIEK